MTLHNTYYAPENQQLAAEYAVPVPLVDDAIDFCLTRASQEDGAHYTDLTPRVWNRISSDVGNYLTNVKETLAPEHWGWDREGEAA